MFNLINLFLNFNQSSYLDFYFLEIILLDTDGYLTHVCLNATLVAWVWLSLPLLINFLI